MTMAHSKATKAKMREAWKRRKKTYHDKLLDAVRATEYKPVEYQPLPNALMPLADRLKQAIDKIEEQIKRLESL